MNVSVTATGVTLDLEASEFNSLASFLATFSNDDVTDLIGTDCGNNVNTIADKLTSMIVSDKEIE